MTATNKARTATPSVSIVVPAMNEARNLEIILPLLPAVHEVILVDGHSVDDTIAVAERVLPDIKVVHQTRRGKGNALACGFEAASGDIIVMFDADGSADPAEIPRFVDALVAGADFAKGSRFTAGGGSEDITRFRRYGNFGLNTLANSIIRMRYTDLCYGYNAFWADILDDLDLPATGVSAINNKSMLWGDGFEIETVINCRIAAAKLKIVEVPSFERSRIHGVSNLNAFSDGFRVLKTIDAERRRARRARIAVATATALAGQTGPLGSENEDAAKAMLNSAAGHNGIMVASTLESSDHDTDQGLVVVTDLVIEPADVNGHGLLIVTDADGDTTHDHAPGLAVVENGEIFVEERSA